MFRNRNWLGKSIWKPKNVHSLDHLKYLNNVLAKNQVVNEGNKSLLVETLRSIAEILIWGDQNDGSVFDFFLEKNMLSFFLKILKQKCGNYVCVQLLQTLNILFENIRNETSLYYLLSNNHVNSIIVHKFDFSEEEVMAYYISFLKTLSLKLNCHTIHFFYNEHTNDFPLYTEAIKFFNHSESMVRIAVRTLTLNVYKVDDKSMLRFIRDRTAAPYFSNLVWFISNHIFQLDACIKQHAEFTDQSSQVTGSARLQLADLVAEHLDHLHYLNDILCLNIDNLNSVLVEHLLNKLFIPLYVMSLISDSSLANYNITFGTSGTPVRQHSTTDNDKHQLPGRISTGVSLFLLSQVFLIIKESELIRRLASILLKGMPSDYCRLNSVPQSPPITLNRSMSINNSDAYDEENVNNDDSETLESTSAAMEPVTFQLPANDFNEANSSVAVVNGANITDEEKEQRLAEDASIRTGSFLEQVVDNLNCTKNDYCALFALCLLHAISNNSGVTSSFLDGLLLPGKSDCRPKYNERLVKQLICIVSLGSQPGSRVRIVTLELAINLLKRLVLLDGNKSILMDQHYAAIVGAKEESISLLRSFYKSEDIFLDMFEDEYYDMKKRPLNVEFLTMDSNILLLPTNTPLSGIEFSKRLPCGEVERARCAIRIFLLVRELVLRLSDEVENQLPLTDRNTCISVGTSLDLNNSDLITCTIIAKDGSKTRRFLAMDSNQLILVEPHNRLIGWGVTKLAGFLQDIEVVGDKEESKCLHVTILHTNVGSSYNAKFLFDDHIRCMAAKQTLMKGRTKARRKKMLQIARLLDLPASAQPSASSSAAMQTYSMLASRHQISSSFYGPYYPIREPSTSKHLSGLVSSVKSHYNFDDISSRSSPVTSLESSPKVKTKMPQTFSEEIQLQPIANNLSNNMSFPVERIDSPTEETNIDGVDTSSSSVQSPVVPNSRKSKGHDETI